MITSSCANDFSFYKVRHLAQLVMALVAYWLGALREIARSNPGGCITIIVICKMVVGV